MLEGTIEAAVSAIPKTKFEFGILSHVSKDRCYKPAWHILPTMVSPTTIESSTPSALL